MQTTIGRYLVERLEQAGVRHAFGVPGDYVLDLMDLIVASPIRLINTCNEVNAGYAADGYARANGIGAAIGGLGVRSQHSKFCSFLSSFGQRIIKESERHLLNVET